jgi:CRP-like cAMP-binding protein
VQWPLLADLPPEDVRELLRSERRRSFRRGEVVFHQGDPADVLHLVRKGRFAVRLTTPLGESVLVSLRGPGDLFGELALLAEGAGRVATVAALEDAETRALARAEFAALQAKHPRVSAVLLRLLAEQLRRTDERLLEAHYVDAETRVRRRLSELVDLYGRAAAADVAIPLTQEEVAQMAGTTRATVNRILREEQAAGRLTLGRGRIVVTEPDRLRAPGR